MTPKLTFDLLHGELARALGVRALPYLRRSAASLGSGMAGGAAWRALWGAEAKPRAFALRTEALGAHAQGLGEWESAILEQMDPAGSPDHPGWTRLLVCGRELEGHIQIGDPLALLLGATWAAASAPAPAPRIMGVVNVTPDSFSDGGRFHAPDAAIAHARDLEAQGAAYLDVGGESTRPGAEPVAPEVELSRVLPVIEALAGQSSARISVDTTKAAVAEAAIEAGASMVNDISAGLADPAMLPLVAEAGVEYVAMHRQGAPADMQADPRYGDPVAEIVEHLRERLAACSAARIDPERVWLDPGIGFGKRLEHNLALLRRLPELHSLGCNLLLGVSRKSFIGHITGAEQQEDWKPSPDRTSPSPVQRLGGTAAALATCVAGGAGLLRVHDVAPMVEAAAVAYALNQD